jgi:3-oxoacyl-(acyl-carrier-protein) synthase
MMSSNLARLLKECPVVVTGMGAVSAAGVGRGALWAASMAGRSLAVRLGFSGGNYCGCAVSEAAQLAWPSPLLRKSDRAAQLAYLAANEAWQQARLGEVTGFRPRLGIIAGTSRGPVSKLIESYEQVQRGRVKPSLAATSTLASLSGTLAAHFLAGGPALTVSSACASSAAAIALAAEQLILGQADVVLAGGAEAPLLPFVLAQLEASGLLGEADQPAQVCRPFDLHRTGIVLGEGAGFLVLETEAGARQRGANILARLSGWSVRAEGGERTGISERADSLVRVMRESLELAGVAADEVDYLNAHGTGTVLNDRQEAVAMRRVFGERAASVPCSSIKPVTGHCMGAAGALEAVLCVEALHHQMVPPTPNYLTIDPACGLNIVAGAPQPQSLRHVLSNSSGFWGNNAALLFSRHQ